MFRNGATWVVLLALLAVSAADAAQCDKRSNNTHQKLLECVTVDGVRAHQAALQAIADANGGIRASGTPGYDASVDYLADTLEAAGYDVLIQSFSFMGWIPLGPSTLEQVAPAPVTYVEGTDYRLMSQTDSGDVTATVTAVDLQLGLGNTSTSGCEAADFAGFPAGNIALIQRGTCYFQVKAENAAAAGAVGAIIFNQGNSSGRFGVINGTLNAGYSGGIPVMFATYGLGEQWSMTPGLVIRMFADVHRGVTVASNVLAETTDGRDDNVVMAGAHLDSVPAGPGIQDNGSGSAALLEIALQMKNVKPTNKLRFAWWAAKEFGLVGSLEYMTNLTGTERDSIALYLNFDMIGSPNFVRFVYDGDGSDTGLTGPPGSGAIESLFAGYYTSLGLAYEPTELDFNSDGAPFLVWGIPAGGITTGDEAIKTPEQAAIYGGTAGEQYDPCYHLACDTFDNISLEALDQNADAAAFAILQYADSTVTVNGVKGKGGPGSGPHTPSGDPIGVERPD